MSKACHIFEACFFCSKRGIKLKSVVSYPNRGKWGDPKYRGNCSGHIIKDLLDYFMPKTFLEVFAGGGTGYEVARDLGYENSVHLDLNPQWGGWNALTDVVPISADLIFCHPPYYNIIVYSGEVWGVPHKDDLSRSQSYSDYIKNINFIHKKLYNSLNEGGRLAILVGDCRKNGVYYSIIKDMQYFGSLESHIIKIQHNTRSSSRIYPKKFIPIIHEHLLIFRKE